MHAKQQIWVVICLAAWWSGTSARAESLEAAIDRMFAGESVAKVQVGRHAFKTQPIQLQQISNGVRATGSFTHTIKGKDDRVYFEVEALRGQPPRGMITAIDVNGFFGGGRIEVGTLVGGKIGGAKGAAAAQGILSGLNAVQRRLIGNWVPAAQQVVDAITAKAATQVK